MSVDPKQISAKLREKAAELRKEAQTVEQNKVVKSAQILTAARGLSAFKKILQGG